MNKEVNNWYAISPANLKYGQIRSIDFWWKKMILWRDSFWNYLLQSRFCTHLWADLWKGRIDNNKIECPFHGFKFDINGQSDGCVPNIRRLIIKEYMWIIWFFNGEIPDYQPQDIMLNNNININLSDYDIINTYDKIYDLPTRLIVSNFFDIAHFQKIHGVGRISYQILNSSSAFSYQQDGEYSPHYSFQKILFKLIPNKLLSTIHYSRNLTISNHKILSSSWKSLIEYYWIFPVTPINESQTLVISNILVKKWMLSMLWKIIWKYILQKATSEEFDMLLWINYNIANYTASDSLLKDFLKFYDLEISSSKE